MDSLSSHKDIKSRSHDTHSSDEDEHFLDANSANFDNDKIVDDLVSQHKHLLISNPPAEKPSDDEGTAEDEEERDCEKFIDCETELIDDESQRQMEQSLTEEEKLANKVKAEEKKNEGNEAFREGEYEKSVDLYTEGLGLCPVDCRTERSILYGNRAAAKIKLEATEAAIGDCTKSLEFNPNYIKALLRRAKLYEDTDKLDESLDDYKKIVEMDPTHADATEAVVHRLPPKIQERNEKMKDEMVGKLKDLGNMILKPFGLSTNNFQMQQDPTSGSYSINFKQN